MTRTRHVGHSCPHALSDSVGGCTGLQARYGTGDDARRDGVVAPVPPCDGRWGVVLNCRGRPVAGAAQEHPAVMWCPSMGQLLIGALVAREGVAWVLIPCRLGVRQFLARGTRPLLSDASDASVCRLWRMTCGV